MKKLIAILIAAPAAILFAPFYIGAFVAQQFSYLSKKTETEISGNARLQFGIE